MTKVELKKIMEDSCIFPSEVEDAINFVYDLLAFRIKKLEENEPYAIKCINGLKKAAYEVWDLHSYVEGVMEEGNGSQD